MECRPTTAPRYTTASLTLHLLADCDGQLDGTGRTDGRPAVTVHLVPAVEHFMVTLGCSYEHYKQ